MPRERAASEVKEPHFISLKVLRLSRPSLSEQLTLPPSTAISELPAQHAHAYPSHPSGESFIYTPLLTLPPAFGSVYIGETFSCILSASNESSTRVSSGVRIQAQMQTPSQTVQLTGDEDEEGEGVELQAGQSTQRTVSYELKEEGGHTLAVMVSYTPSPGDATRTFKKLYQFIAQQCIMVRTKAGRLPPGKQAILEAQLENLGEGSVALQKVSMKTKWRWRSLNWDVTEGEGAEAPLLRSREILQVAFLLEPPDIGGETEIRGGDAGEELGMLNIEWRTSCGDKGFLRTGKLMLPPV
ncbi:hypothetical protein FN846DRAFT_780196 [Sphaerosporella brunnea]|uniref:Trafficking protein particle complex subunit 13 n=1 Tax=Sphaerosporella brunnea TaxID=1250544 RepID=A0A5J5EUB1_9PEZI|nr:hypothetical protein FN846DRAFT_67586 [Sphaerosporella brunnea]KAA8903190.1 hypothetical protein FN846DRAFT_780196 [Sphaerosporella brunnea]